MAFKLADFVKETTTSTGTGSIALAGAATGYRAFSAKLSIGDTTTYSIRAVDVTGAPTGEWELVGGTYTGVNTLSRDTVLASSNSDAAVSFSAGTKEVYITMPSARASWIRERLTANRTYYVRTDGSDSNTGLANTSGGAFLTLQKAAAVIAETLDLGGFMATVSVADGTYTGGVVLPEYVGAGSVAYLGNATTPSNVVISTTSAGCFSAASAKNFTVNGFKLQTTTSGNCLMASRNAKIQFSNLEFGVCAGNHISSSDGALIEAATNYTISGGAGVHVLFVEGGFVTISGKTVTLTGTPAFSSGFCYGRNVAGFVANACTFSGTATGVRYSINNAASCYVAGAATTYLPGSSAGTTAAGGVYG